MPQDLTFNYSIEAWDGLGSAFMNISFSLHVPANAGPTLSVMSDITLAPGTVVQLKPGDFAFDEDDAAADLRFTASVAPNGSAAVAVLVGVGEDGTAVVYVIGLQPTADSPEKTSVTLRVTDSGGAFFERQVNVTVQRSSSSTLSATSESGTLLLATLLAAAALGISAFALVSSRMGPKKE